MGLSKAGLKIFLREAQRRPFSGRLLTLGRQDAHFDYAFVERAAREFGLGLKPPDHIELSHKPELAEAGRVSDRTLFRALGFSECLSTDYSDFEGADVVLDLNRPDTPEELRDRFDVVFDGGTMEHVFHVPNALAHICRSVRVGGRAIHMAPASNHVDHGFYMFSPTLFWDFYAANGFEIETCQIYRYWPEHNTEPWEVVDYTPGSLDRLSFGGLDDGLYGVVYRRVEGPEACAPPQAGARSAPAVVAGLDQGLRSRRDPPGANARSALAPALPARARPASARPLLAGPRLRMTDVIAAQVAPGYPSA
jgi:SAM-dependent methyltransferase